MKHVALRNCSLSDDGMEILLNHDLVSLSLWYCDNVTQKSWQTLIEHGQNLEYLELGRYVDILKYAEPNEKTPIEFTLNIPHIRKLILTGVVLQPAVNFNQLHQLNYLDLTQCTFHNDFTLEAIVNLPNLTTLILFNVWPLEQELTSICQLKALRKLDISTGYFNTNNYGTFKNPNEVPIHIAIFKSINFLIVYFDNLLDIGTNCRKSAGVNASGHIRNKFSWQWCGSI